MIGIIFSILVLAATSSARSLEIQNQVDKLVTKISDDLKRTYVGKIRSVGTSSVIIGTDEGDRTVSTNEVTSVYRVRSGNRAEVTFNSLKSGDELTAFGTIDPGNMEMTAKQIIAKIHRYAIAGAVTAAQDNVLTIKEFTGAETKVDISSAVALKKNLGTVFSTAKLADFKVGATVFITAYTDPADPTTLQGLKALIISL